jgi:hypothetical protein
MRPDRYGQLRAQGALEEKYEREELDSDGGRKKANPKTNAKCCGERNNRFQFAGWIAISGSNAAVKFCEV